MVLALLREKLASRVGVLFFAPFFVVVGTNAGLLLELTVFRTDVLLELKKRDSRVGLLFFFLALTINSPPCQNRHLRSKRLLIKPKTWGFYTQLKKTKSSPKYK
jgi:hypothetical protein